MSNQTIARALFKLCGAYIIQHQIIYTPNGTGSSKRCGRLRIGHTYKGTIRLKNRQGDRQGTQQGNVFGSDTDE